MLGKVIREFDVALRNEMADRKPSRALIAARSFSFALEDVMCDLVYHSSDPVHASYLNAGGIYQQQVRNLFLNADFCVISFRKAFGRVDMVAVWERRQALENTDVEELGRLYMMFNDDYETTADFQYRLKDDPV